MKNQEISIAVICRETDLIQIYMKIYGRFHLVLRQPTELRSLNKEIVVSEKNDTDKKGFGFSSLTDEMLKTEISDYRKKYYAKVEIEKALDEITPAFKAGGRSAITIPQLAVVFSITGLCDSIDPDHLGTVMMEIRTHFWKNGLLYFNLIAVPKI